MRLFADDTLIYSTIEHFKNGPRNGKWNLTPANATSYEYRGRKILLSLTTSLRTTVRFGHPPPLSRRRIVQQPRLGPACKYQSHEGQSITRISPAKPEQLLWESETGSLQSPCEASRGIRQLSLGLTLKNNTRQKIEGVQRRAALFVKNCYMREPGTVTDLLDEFNWIPLKVRRTLSRLTLFHRAIHRDGGLAFPDCCEAQKTFKEL